MTPEKEFNWNRFWCPSNGSYSLGEDGFLLDPESPSAKYYKSTALRFDEIPDMPCIVFLGEPGIGKTRAMEDALESYQIDGAIRIARIDLRPYITDASLVSDLEKDQEIKNWINGDYHLILFFDSLDECLLNIKTVSTVLVDRLIRRWPYKRLSLRFACRTVDWPTLLDNELRSLYDLKELPKYELLPLRKKDVRIAASQNGIDPENFLRAVTDAEVAMFANRPVTLKFLLGSYKKDGHLPKLKQEIYWQGCFQLCEERNKSRLASKQIGFLSPAQRLIIASRIAAIMILSNKFAVWTDVDSGDIPAEDVILRNLSGFAEKVDGNEFVVNEVAIRETLDTGLFSSLGSHRMGFAHHTYMEYLAAYYITRSQTPSNQAIDLIAHFDGKIVPQLQELAVWLSTFSSSIFEKIVAIQPELTLRVDRESITDFQKKKIIDALLRSYEKGELYDSFDSIKYLGRLSHKGISKQIKAIIANRGKKVETRILAILIVRECNLVDLVDLLVSVAVNAKDEFMVRKYCAYTTEAIGLEKDKSKLLPLAMGRGGFDYQDELRGIGLSAVWPKQISIVDLLGSLTPLQDSSFFGAYNRFLSYEFVENMADEDLPIALKWLVDKMPYFTNETINDSITVQVMKKAWADIENPEVRNWFVKLVDRRIRNYEENHSYEKNKSYLSEIENQQEKRRILITELVRIISHVDDVYYLFSVSPSIVVHDDLDWVINKISFEEHSDGKRIWTQILLFLIDRRNQNDVEKAYTVYESLPVVKDMLDPLFAPIQLDSEMAISLRKYEQRNREVEQRKEDVANQPVEHQFRLLEYIDQFEEGDIDAWWKLNVLFLYSESNLGYELDADISLFPLWKMINEVDRLRLIIAAKKYLISRESGEIFTEDNSIFRPVLSGFRAFYLIAVQDPTQLNTLPVAVWRKWASVLLSYPEAGRKYELSVHQLLIDNLIKVDSQSFYTQLEQQINKEKLVGELQILRLIENIDTDELQNILSPLLGADTLSSYSYSQLLQFLLVRNNPFAKEYAEKLVLSDILIDSDRDRRFHSVRSLIFFTNDAGWTTINRRLKVDNEFGEDLFLRLAGNYDNLTTTLVKKISEQEISNLYIWLEGRFPAQEDPILNSFHTVSNREQVGRFRDALIRALVNIGSEQACEMIRVLIKKYPKKEWLIQSLLSCEQNFRRNTWIPLEPYRVLEIVRNSYIQHIKSQRRLQNLFITVLNIIVSASIAILPSFIDPEKSLGVKFLASNQFIIIGLLILSNIVLVLINTNSRISEK